MCAACSKSARSAVFGGQVDCVNYINHSMLELKLCACQASLQGSRQADWNPRNLAACIQDQSHCSSAWTCDCSSRCHYWWRASKLCRYHRPSMYNQPASIANAGLPQYSVSGSRTVPMLQPSSLQVKHQTHLNHMIQTRHQQSPYSSQ